jgi:hypothetical protein
MLFPLSVAPLPRYSLSSLNAARHKSIFDAQCTDVRLWSRKQFVGLTCKPIHKEAYPLFHRGIEPETAFEPRPNSVFKYDLSLVVCCVGSASTLNPARRKQPMARGLCKPAVTNSQRSFEFGLINSLE